MKQFFSALTVVGFLLPLVGSAAQAVSERRSISVSGTCTRQITPDRGSITVTVEIMDMDLQVAAKKATETYDKVKEAVQKLRLENPNLTTSEYSLIEVKEWQKDRNVFKGFRARMGLRVATSSIQRLGEVITIAAKQGVRDVGALNTFLSQEKLLKEQSNCLEEAGANATARATRLASSLDAKLGEVLEITEASSSGQPSPPPIVMNAMMSKRMNMMGGAEDAAAPSVEAGAQTLNVTIYATFAIK